MGLENEDLEFIACHEKVIACPRQHVAICLRRAFLLYYIINSYNNYGSRHWNSFRLIFGPFYFSVGFKSLAI